MATNTNKVIKMSFKARYFDKNDSWFKIIVIYFCLALMSFISVYPILNILTASLRPGDQLFSTDLSIIPKNATFSNYVKAFVERDTLIWIKNSIIVSGFSCIVGMSFSILAGYGLSRFRFKGRKIGMVFLLVTQMFPAALTLLPLVIMIKSIKFFDNNLLSLAVPYVATMVPFNTWLMKGFFDTIPRALEESAYVDGAGILKAFFFIILPLSRAGIAINALFAFLSCWTEYIVARVVIKAKELYTLPLGLVTFQQDFFTEWGVYSAAALVTAMPVIIMFVFLSKYIIGNMNLGAVKE